ncbi:MAG: MarR family transcriptional regulator [Candidatus Thorarchaeota archaeon]
MNYAIVCGSISDTEAREKYYQIRRAGTARLITNDPTVEREKAFSSEMRSNVEKLLKRKSTNPQLYIDAMSVDKTISFSNHIAPPFKGLELRVLKHLIKNPLSSFSDIARVLKVHPTTISRIYHRLCDIYRFYTGCTADRWKFGLRSFILFFESKTVQSWNAIKNTLTRYPFFLKYTEDLINQNHYCVFIFPHEREVVNRFIESIPRFAMSNFASYRLHELTAAGFFYNTDLMTQKDWKISQSVLNNVHPEALPSDFMPMMHSCKNNPALQPRDFFVTQAIGNHFRAKACEVSHRLISLDIKMTREEASYRKRKLLKNDAVIPSVVWRKNRFCVLRIEILNSRLQRDKILAAALQCPYGVYSITSEGLVLWIGMPLSHSKLYIHYFNNLFESLEIKFRRLSMSKYWNGGGPITDVVGDWNYGPRGFSTRGLDLNPDLCDY